MGIEIQTKIQKEETIRNRHVKEQTEGQR